MFLEVEQVICSYCSLEITSCRQTTEEVLQNKKPSVMSFCLERAAQSPVQRKRQGWPATANHHPPSFWCKWTSIYKEPTFEYMQKKKMLAKHLARRFWPAGRPLAPKQKMCVREMGLDFCQRHLPAIARKQEKGKWMSCNAKVFCHDMIWSKNTPRIVPTASREI